MEKYIIDAAQRHVVRSVQNAMQGNAIRALIELITNSDDSYCDLEDAGIQNSGIIEIHCRKDGYSCAFAVRDEAEGMTREELRNSFGEKSYGAATSGLKEGKRRRGYFGQGGKDALGGMKDGRIATVKNNSITECRIYIEKGRLYGEMEDTIPITNEMRLEHGIKGNGTVAYFTADPEKTGTVPRLERVQEEVANNYMLRKIMSNPRRKIFLTDESNEDRRRLRSPLPEGKESLNDNFVISYKSFPPFKIHFSLWRSEHELSQCGDDRVGGILIIDDASVVLDISLFKYDNEPLASRFFGEVVIDGFRELLKQEEPVLTEERNGLAGRHPFCQSLRAEIEKRLQVKIDEEKNRKQKEALTKFDLQEASRYKKAFHILNEIAKLEVESVMNLGENPDEEVDRVPDGFCLYPSSAQITVDKRYAFQLRLDTRVVRHGSIIKASCTCPKVKLETSEIRVSSEDGTGIIKKFITLRAGEPNVQGALRVSTGTLMKEAKIFVVPEKELLFTEGMVFQPESVTLRPNKPRRVYLLVYVKMIEGGNTIRLMSDNESVRFSKSEIRVNDADAERHVAKYEVEIWGERDGQEAWISAHCEHYDALLEVHVHSKEESPKGPTGMFNEPSFNCDLEPTLRSAYSAETGKVIIYVNFPSVFHYLGEAARYRTTLPAQVFLADLVAERCFFEMARKRVANDTLIKPEARADKIQLHAYELSKKYGRRIHEALVDQNLLSKSKFDPEQKA